MIESKGEQEMAEWRPLIPESAGCYFYRSCSEMSPAVVIRTKYGFLFHGVERFVSPRDMPGEVWSEPIKSRRSRHRHQRVEAAYKSSGKEKNRCGKRYATQIPPPDSLS